MGALLTLVLLLSSAAPSVSWFLCRHDGVHRSESCCSETEQEREARRQRPTSITERDCCIESSTALPHPPQEQGPQGVTAGVLLHMPVAAVLRLTAPPVVTVLDSRPAVVDTGPPLLRRTCALLI